MKRTSIIMLALILAGLALAGCIGGGNPADSHDQTTTTETDQSTIQGATLTNTRNTCIGILNVASCNTSQLVVSAQSAGITGQPEETAAGVPLAQSAGMFCGGFPIILFFGAIVVFVLIIGAGAGR